MAFESKNLKLLSYAGGFTLWHYHSVDNIKAMEQRDYFNMAGDLLQSGDLIIVQATANHTHQKNKKHNKKTPPINSSDKTIDMGLIAVTHKNESKVVTQFLIPFHHKRRW